MNKEDLTKLVDIVIKALVCPFALLLKNEVQEDVNK